MNLLEALLLGAVQGITEFLPVSSSGHLILFQHLLGFKDLKQYVLFDVVCHAGTLGAVLFVFYKSLREVFASKQKLLMYVIATLPLFPLVLLLKPIKSVFDRPDLLGYFFLVTALILFVGDRFSKIKPTAENKRNALKIGISQAFAIIPGISRSGTTISCARLLGWSPLHAVTFSFLLSIPTVLGGIALEGMKVSGMALPDIDLITYVAGALTAFFVGLFSLKLLIRIVETATFQVFAWYCAALGALTLYLF